MPAWHVGHDLVERLKDIGGLRHSGGRKEWEVKILEVRTKGLKCQRFGGDFEKVRCAASNFSIQFGLVLEHAE